MSVSNQVICSTILIVKVIEPELDVLSVLI